MNNPTDLIQLYVLLSYEKLQRARISQHRRPIEASLCNRLLVWRFLKKIENEPVTNINCEEDFSAINYNLDNNDPWILDLDTNCNDLMDMESDLITDVDNNDISHHPSTCETMHIDQTSDVTSLLKRAIGAERRQKSSSDNFHFNENDSNNLHHMSETNSTDEAEQFFHDLCAELTNTTASIVSSSTTNTLNFSTSSEQTLIH